MTAVLIKIGTALFYKLVTEAFFSKMATIFLWQAAKSTANTLDDKIVRAVAEPLGTIDLID